MKHAVCLALFAVAVLTVSPVQIATAKDIPTMPAAMIGTWGWDGEACRHPDDDGRVTVTATSVAFFASSYDVQSIVEESDGTIRATGIVHEEGEPETAQGTLRLKVVPERRLWVLTDTDLDHVYSFCP